MADRDHPHAPTDEDRDDRDPRVSVMEWLLDVGQAAARRFRAPTSRGRGKLA